MLVGLLLVLVNVLLWPIIAQIWKFNLLNKISQYFLKWSELPLIFYRQRTFLGILIEAKLFCFLLYYIYTFWSKLWQYHKYLGNFLRHKGFHSGHDNHKVLIIIFKLKRKWGQKIISVEDLTWLSFWWNIKLLSFL